MEQQATDLAQPKNVVILAPNLNQGVLVAKNLNINRFKVYTAWFQIMGMNPDKVYLVNWYSEFWDYNENFEKMHSEVSYWGRRGTEIEYIET